MATMLDFVVQGSSDLAKLTAKKATLTSKFHFIELLCPAELDGKKVVSASFRVSVKTKKRTFGVWSAAVGTSEDVSLAPGARARITLSETIGETGLGGIAPTDVDKTVTVKEVVFLAAGASLEGGLITPNPEGETITKDVPGAVTPPPSGMDPRVLAMLVALAIAALLLILLLTPQGAALLSSLG